MPTTASSSLQAAGEQQEQQRRQSCIQPCLPRLLDTNAASRLIMGRRILVLMGRCVETEKPWVLDLFPRDRYAILTACPEAEHINMIGFKLAGIMARLPIEELVVVTTDGSMHCIQLHYVAEEVERILGRKIRRRHYVVESKGLVEIPPDAVKTSRYLSKVAKLLRRYG
jgi:hypothetical protein